LSALNTLRTLRALRTSRTWRRVERILRDRNGVYALTATETFFIAGRRSDLDIQPILRAAEHQLEIDIGREHAIDHLNRLLDRPGDHVAASLLVIERERELIRASGEPIAPVEHTLISKCRCLLIHRGTRGRERERHQRRGNKRT
jgi:hypothetical protein